MGKEGSSLNYMGNPTKISFNLMGKHLHASWAVESNMNHSRIKKYTNFY